MADTAHCIQEAAGPAFARDVREGLLKAGQKELPSKYFYDDVGSALFEVITLLPEYGLTRADERLLRNYACDMAGLVPGRLMVAELGSGTGRKTRWMLEAVAARQGRVAYLPIDVSGGALARCRQELSVVSAAEIYPLEHSYLGGLREAALQRGDGERLLLLFLGSTIGNFDRTGAEEFLREVHSLLQPGDALLLGADVVKPVAEMLIAYDDPAGVTAAFNLNVLARINRELGGGFDPRAFAHEARYDAREQRIEMHLRSRRRQAVPVGAAGITAVFEEGETIWTESSYKFDVDRMPAMAQRTGFQSIGQWVDQEWAFVENLWLRE